ncbi:hypothetical protein MBM_02705 [Drepanopeziza brunnea f. sp. 'multigermtubi' MB_m1]|uniref:Uncharacterized protein n=1 Tax=Marssonina brunnea f. sp. multigermtubi (strain MB_m1) TaxID=1072389 RepID=K1XEY7_MARBU|nr:uncharacterized protein MBM_02705 [Drepanopeziza brunnea f. sp. 'multigermtubi' MB_m1]EKD19468.1 hypothetical protein MBM_02705 [Drepanopeziza brunnea f. sp. 'multigermtubi' MB_m1]
MLLESPATKPAVYIPSTPNPRAFGLLSNLATTPQHLKDKTTFIPRVLSRAAAEDLSKDVVEMDTPLYRSTVGASPYTSAERCGLTIPIANSALQEAVLARLTSSLCNWQVDFMKLVSADDRQTNLSGIPLPSLHAPGYNPSGLWPTDNNLLAGKTRSTKASADEWHVRREDNLSEESGRLLISRVGINLRSAIKKLNAPPLRLKSVNTRSAKGKNADFKEAEGESRVDKNPCGNITSRERELGVTTYCNCKVDGGQCRRMAHPAFGERRGDMGFTWAFQKVPDRAREREDNRANNEEEQEGMSNSTPDNMMFNCGGGVGGVGGQLGAGRRGAIDIGGSRDSRARNQVRDQPMGGVLMDNTGNGAKKRNKVEDTSTVDKENDFDQPLLEARYQDQANLSDIFLPSMPQ